MQDGRFFNYDLTYPTRILEGKLTWARNYAGIAALSSSPLSLLLVLGKLSSRWNFKNMPEHVVEAPAVEWERTLLPARL